MSPVFSHHSLRSFNFSCVPRRPFANSERQREAAKMYSFSILSPLDCRSFSLMCSPRCDCFAAIYSPLVRFCRSVGFWLRRRALKSSLSPSPPPLRALAPLPIRLMEKMRSESLRFSTLSVRALCACEYRWLDGRMDGWRERARVCVCVVVCVHRRTADAPFTFIICCSFGEKQFEISRCTSWSKKVFTLPLPVCGGQKKIVMFHKHKPSNISSL